ncbi:MAG: hypothetical protein LUE64_05235 [Candidatus Gastranaerophilales bacterium]|nr:hypothetical protein [Candidatus Gastranaerophilales bacterium]
MKNKNIKQAFSLAEVLIATLILAIILIFAIPVITKRAVDTHTKTEGGQAGFYYRKSSNLNSALPCYHTYMDASTGYTYIKDNTGSCEVYDFTVPANVHKVDITLVGGGGGGGGAAGGTTYEYEWNYDGGPTTLSKIPLSRLKRINVNFLTERGYDGTASTFDGEVSGGKNTICAGYGGASAPAIVDYNIPVSYLKSQADYSPNFSSELSGGYINLAYLADGGAKSNLYSASGDCWYTAKTNNSSSSSCSGLYLAASSTGSICKATDSTNVSNYSDLGIKITNSSGTQILPYIFSSTWICKNAGYHRTIYTDIYYDSLTTTDTTKKSLATEAQAALHSGVSGEAPTLANPSFSESTSYMVTSGYIIRGGRGAHVQGVPLEYGAGSDGTGLMVLCKNSAVDVTSTSISSQAASTCAVPSFNNGYTQTDDDTDATNDRLIKAPTESAKPKGARATVYIEHPGGVGSGGTAGSAVKIKNFSVTPGDTYKIVVGSGGGGGSAGKAGTLLTSGTYKTETMAGYDGTSGSSTAIYRVDSKGAYSLLMLVAGGVPGKGGKVNTSAETIPTGSSSIDFSTLPYPAYPASSYYIPAFVIGEDMTLSLDTSVLRGLSKKYAGADGYIIPAKGTAYRIIYAYRCAGGNVNDTCGTDNHTTIPLFEFDRNSTDAAQGVVSVTTSRDSNVVSGTYRNTNAFKLYSGPNHSTATTPVYLKPDAYFDGTSSSSKYVYNGLHYAYKTGNVLSYAGGLGGFNGLGGKAGCGGLFVGNMDGRYGTSAASAGSSTSTSSVLKGTFTINTTSATGSTSAGIKTYAINDFFGGCSLATSNGGTAEFIPPSYSSVSGEYLGQAGSGGGGGGWNSELGAGNGGKGQDGYVFIKWH